MVATKQRLVLTLLGYRSHMTGWDAEEPDVRKTTAGAINMSHQYLALDDPDTLPASELLSLTLSKNAPLSWIEGSAEVQHPEAGL